MQPTRNSWLHKPELYYFILIISHVINVIKYSMALPFFAGLDETGHISYAIFILQTGIMFPDMTTMPMLGVDFLPSDNLIYLHHPPVYYWFMAAVAALGDGVANQIVVMRLANVVISTLTLIVSIACLERLPLTPQQRVFGAAMMTLAPMLSAIGGAVSNDNQALFGGAVAVFGLCRLLDGQRNFWSWSSLALGAALAASSKANAAILVTAFALGGLLLMARFDPSLWRRPQPWLVGLVIGLAFVPYLIFLIRYGSPVPTFPGIVARGRPQPGEPERVVLAFLPYCLHFLRRLLFTWASMVTPSAPYFVAPAILFLMTAAGLALGVARLRQGERNALVVVAALAAVAVAICLPIHFVTVYRAHLHGNLPGGIWSRYYMPLMPALTGAAILAIRQIPTTALRTGGQVALVGGAYVLYLMR